jgi:integrase
MRVGRTRTKNKGLPKRVYLRHGAYYFVATAGKWIRLGKSLGEAYRALAQLVEVGPVETINDLCDRYDREVLLTYREKERQGRLPHLARIRAVMGEIVPRDLTGADVRAFRDKVGERRGLTWGRPELARKALMVLSHMFSWAAEWGVVDANPCSGVQRPPMTRRNRCPTDAEFFAVRARCPTMHKIAMDVALLTGLRREDILKLERDSETDDGLLVDTGKTDKPLLFLWSDELRAVLKRAWAERPQVRRALICNRKGKRYTGDGFSKMWRRAHDAALKAKEIAAPFTFNDIRAKSASDDSDPARASNRLGHTTQQTTERFYIRTPRKVEPLR